MKKIFLFIFTLLAICSCSNEDEMQSSPALLGAKETTAFVKLADDATDVAGVIKIVADVPEAELTWITTPICNLDTSQTTVVLKNGVGELPVRWLNKQENGRYAPEATAFNAWVRIKTGDKLTDVPLILAEGIDSTKLMPTVQTRAGEMLPRVTSLSFNPTEVNLQNATGGNCQLIVEGPGNVTIDYSNINNDHRIDKTNLPETVTESTTLNFQWVGGVPPTTAFSVTIQASAELFWASCTLKYDPNGTGGDVDLRYVSNTMPATGNLPAKATVYTFNFEGGYTGQLRVRSVNADTGEVLFNGPIGTTHSPKVTVPENTATTTRNIKFQYRVIDIAGSPWIDLPANTNRVQDGTNGGGSGTGGIIASTIIPAGDIPDEGGTYFCNFTGTYTGTVILRVTVDGVEKEKTSGNVPSLMQVVVPGLTTQKQVQVRFEYSKDGGNTWILIETRVQNQETLSIYPIEPTGAIPSAGATVTCSLYGTYSKRVTIHAKVGDTIIASSSGTVPSTVSLQIPAYTGNDSRLVIFEYSRNNGPWMTMETKKQLGN